MMEVGSQDAARERLAPQGPCLYCKRTTGPFTSVEHIFPESAGNRELILPRGVVCDPCNSGLGWLDDEFLRFEPVQFYRALQGIPNKAGRRQPAAFSNVRIEHPVPGHITVKVQGTRYFTPKPDGGRLDMIGRRYTPARCQALARAFYKIGLGLLYLDDSDFALWERFDEVRKVILGEVEPHGYLIIGRKSEAENEVRVLYQTGTIQGQPATAFEMSIFGLLVFFEMERRSLDPKLKAEARGLGHNILVF